MEDFGDGKILEGLIEDDSCGSCYSAYTLLTKEIVRNVNQKDVYWTYYKLCTHGFFAEANRLTKRYFYWFDKGKKWGI